MNPFLKAFDNKTWGTRDESIPFREIQLDHFLPALEVGIEKARENIKKIKKNAEPPSFTNTIVALEQCAELMETVAGVYFNLFSAEANAELQTLAREISPRAAAFSSELNLDAELFKRVQKVYLQRDTLGLSGEEKMLVEKTYINFTRNGALLEPADKEKLRQIDQELSVLSPLFSENVLKATNAFEMVLTDKADLAGLPESVIEAAAAEAELRGHPGTWCFSLQAPSYIPFLQYSAHRHLREKMWKAYNGRAFEGENSNQEIILKTIHLKDQRAKILGFKNFADFTLAERMAESQQKVSQFLQSLLKPSKPAAERDLQELKDFARELDQLGDLSPWDFGYYSEKLKEKKYAFNAEELRPYFQLENVIQGVFAHAEKLYGLKFTEVHDVQTYHPDVRVFEVTDTSQKYIGLFYTDFFPRETKKDGAWMTSFRDQGVSFGKVHRPHISIVCNFTKPSANKPSLLSYDEVSTLFHEFGHALHGLLSDVTFKSLAGTSVYWDFVELPSQIMENWVTEKEGLDLFASHFQTHEKIPTDLVQKIKRSERFQAGYYSLRQINFAMLDLAWYSTPPEKIRSVIDFENDSMAQTRLFPYVPGTCTSTAFSHIFAGGYAAGYYSYKWAEVLDADAFEHFKEKGIFNAEVAKKFREHILSKGGTEHPMALYKKFRGREPDPNSLLRRDGLIP